MTSPRRDIRPTRDFYLALERQLPLERGLAGQPSRADFQFHELLPILSRFFTGWDDLPQLVADRDDYRVLVIRGVLLRAISVIGQLAPDGVIELATSSSTPPGQTMRRTNPRRTPATTDVPHRRGPSA